MEFNAPDIAGIYELKWKRPTSEFDVNGQRIIEWRRRYHWNTGIAPNISAHISQRSRLIDWTNRVESPKFSAGKINLGLDGFLPRKPYRGRDQ